MSWYFKILLMSLIFTLMSCSSLKCNPGVIKYKVNINNIDNITNKEITKKDYVTNLMDSITPGFKCLFY